MRVLQVDFHACKTYNYEYKRKGRMIMNFLNYHTSGKYEILLSVKRNGN